MHDAAAIPFHLLRPLWLLALIPVAAIFALLLWRQNAASAMGRRDRAASAAAPDRAAGPGARHHPALSRAAGMVLGIIALSGPTWRRELPPFVEDKAPLMIVLALSSSMDQTDVAPTRLERAKQKIKDLLAARAGARSGLIAYAGTAHLVMPLTDDRVGHRAVPCGARDRPDAGRRKERHGSGFAGDAVRWRPNRLPARSLLVADDLDECGDPPVGRPQRRRDVEGGARTIRRGDGARLRYRACQRRRLRHPGDRAPDRNPLPGGARRRLRHAMAGRRLLAAAPAGVALSALVPARHDGGLGGDCLRRHAGLACERAGAASPLCRPVADPGPAGPACVRSRRLCRRPQTLSPIRCGAGSPPTAPSTS